jgi:hypothetical protein
MKRLNTIAIVAMTLFALFAIACEEERDGSATPGFSDSPSCFDEYGEYQYDGYNCP